MHSFIKYGYPTIGLSKKVQQQSVRTTSTSVPFATDNTMLKNVGNIQCKEGDQWYAAEVENKMSISC